MFSPFVALWLDDSSRNLIKCYFRRLALGCFCLLVEPTSPSLLDHRWLKRACCEVPVNFSIYESKSLFPDGSRNQQIGRCRWDQNDPVAEIIITMNPLYILNCPNEAHRWNYLPPWPFTVRTLPKLVCLLPQKLIKCFWIESFLHQISNWRYFGLGVIWEWNRLQISPSATCSLTFSLRPDSVWPAWKWDVIFVSAASSFLFLFLLPLPLPASCFLFLLLTPSLPLQTCCWHLWTFIWRWAFGSVGLWSGGSRDVWLQRWAPRFLPPDELGPDSQSHKLL